MRFKSVLLLACVGGCLAPAAADADGLVIPGLGPDLPASRPGYREAVFPPPQTNVLGFPAPSPALDRPGYRDTYNQFPPPGGRYGGGFLEYVLTGGRPEPVPSPAYGGYRDATASAAITPAGGFFGLAAGVSGPSAAVNPQRASLPRGGLPDYAPQPSADGSALSAGPQSFYSPPAAPQGVGLASLQPDLAERPSRSIDPTYNRQVVAYSGHERAGTIIIDTPDKFLYLVRGNGEAIRYGIGVGRPGFAWAGVKSITRKAEWPGWTPPVQMLKRRPDLPRHMVGGEANPLGARALYLGSSLYRIHGTNEPETIGTNVSSGCIRMMNQDVIDLYARVGVGARVVVL